MPVETTFDISKNMMYTKTDELGTYCIMDMEIWLDSLGGAELLEAAQAETEPENEPEAQTMKINTQKLGTTMSLQPLLSAPVGQSLANPKKKNVIFIAENTIEFNEYFELSKDFITRKGDYAELISFDYDSSKETKYDVSEKVLEYLNRGGYDKNADTYIFLVFNEEKQQPDDSDETDEKDDFRASENSTAFALLSELSSLGGNRPYISLITTFSEYESYGFLVKLTVDEDKKGTIINLNAEKFVTSQNKKNKVIAEIYYYLYATDEPLMYISSVGLTPLPPEFDMFTLDLYYSEYLNRSGMHLEDTDLDGLYNYEEIDFSSGLIKRTAKADYLPTFAECLLHKIVNKKYTYVQYSLDRFITDVNTNDSILNILDGVRILPINSDPTMVDGDGDGILDIDEFEWNEIDERYRNISPLRADTVESLYPEFSGRYNLFKKSKPIYLDIEGNHITINYRYIFTSHESESKDESESTDNKELTKEELLEGAKYVWSHSYDVPNNSTNDKDQLPYFKGKLYDFYPGMKITVELNFIDANEKVYAKTVNTAEKEDELHFIEKNDKSIKFNYYNENIAGGTITGSSDYNWFNSNSTHVEIYKKQKNGIVVDNDKIIYAFSHELGHTFGLADAYASINDGYEIYTNYYDPNIEFPFINKLKRNTFEAGEIMLFDGLPSSNDIEMILQAFVERRTQWFYFEPTKNPGYKVSISKAIKNPVIIYIKAIDAFVNSEGEIESIDIPISYHAYKQYEKENELEEISLFELN